MLAIWAMERGIVYDACFDRLLGFGRGDRLEPVWEIYAYQGQHFRIHKVLKNLLPQTQLRLQTNRNQPAETT